MITKKYQIIYADPPWSFKTYSDKGKDRSAEKHYLVMKLDDIKALNVASIAADNCILFFWATYPNLLDAIDVINAWGFTYKSVSFTWVKTTKNDKWHIGCGYWTRANPEICLLATRGHPKRISKSVRNLVVSPVRKHSQKPDEVRDRIVQLMGDIPRIELFAREKVAGWDSIGMDIDGSDIRTVL